MKVDLRALKPNPTRDFAIDPVDEEIVARLQQSIEDHGFWGGVSARRRNGEVEVAAGWHRIKAALKAKVSQADIFIGDFDDDAMIRVYAVENATQRGNSSTALAGTIASAVRYLAKSLMAGDGDVAKIFATSEKGLEILRGQLASKGVGRAAIERFLHDVPNINEGVVTQQLANLKASGDYDRIIDEVCQEIEREYKRGEVSEEVVEAAREVAEQTEEGREDPTFDLEGVSKHLKNAHQVDVFRKVVTGKGVTPYLPVNRQAALAKSLVALAEERGAELSARFIRENVMSLVGVARGAQRKLDKEEREELAKKDWQNKARLHQSDVAMHARSILASMTKLVEHNKKRPHGVTLHVTSEFRTAAQNLERAVALMKKAGLL